MTIDEANREVEQIRDEINREEKRLKGKIIKVSKEGYGFITSIEIPFTRIFFHWSALEPKTKKFTELRSGMKVSFVPFITDEKGYRAIKILVEE